MMRYADINNGLVVNIVEADPKYAATQEWKECPDNVGIGWCYLNGVFTPPPEPISEKAKLASTLTKHNVANYMLATMALVYDIVRTIHGS